MIQSSLKEKSIKVDFDGGYYEWHRRDRAVEKDVGDRAGVTSSAGRYQKNTFLGPDHLLHSLRQVIQHARTASENMTLPWEPSRRLLLNINFLPHQKKMIECRNALDALFIHLDSDWQDMMLGAKSSLGPLYNPDNYPTLEEVKQRTYIKATFYPMADASDVRLQADEEMVDAIRTEVERNQSQLFDDAVFHVWERIHKIVANAKGNLEKTTFRGARFRTEWFDHLAELTPVLKGLNLNEDPRLDKMADELDSFCLAYTEKGIKGSASSRFQATQSMNQIHQDLTAIFGPMQKEREDV